MLSVLLKRALLRRGLTFALLLLLTQIQAFAQCSSIIDLNGWAEQGPPANGTWNVNAAGTSVTQTINSYPTFFVSPQEFINVRITGTLQTTGTDDDFIGFAIGYRNPIGGAGSVFPVETWLFDWKRGTQTVNGANILMGQYLSQINGNFDLTIHGPEFWGHQNQNGFNVVASNTGPGTGWAVGTVYNFELTYLSSQLTIAINGDTIFDVPGCYEPGRFGFYNYSQGPTVYSNFAYELIPEFNITAPSVCLGDSAEFQYVSDTCSSSMLTNSVVASWRWDFGDGDTSALASPSHLYGAIGTYNVTLVVTDNFGCPDSVTRQITIVDCPVPVMYSYFEVRPDEQDAFLEWETFSESENTGFEIWRSENGQDYQQVGWVVATKRNAEGTFHYQFRDTEVRSGTTYYYRLHQIDLNGQANLSEVRQVTMASDYFAEITAFPNPTKGVVRLQLPRTDALEEDGLVTMELYNLAGRRQEVKVSTLFTSQMLELAVDLSPLPVGIYIAKVYQGNLPLGVVKLLRANKD